MTTTIESQADSLIHAINAMKHDHDRNEVDAIMLDSEAAWAYGPTDQVFNPDDGYMMGLKFPDGSGVIMLQEPTPKFDIVIMDLRKADQIESNMNKLRPEMLAYSVSARDVKRNMRRQAKSRGWMLMWSAKGAMYTKEPGWLHQRSEDGLYS